MKSGPLYLKQNLLLRYYINLLLKNNANKFGDLLRLPLFMLQINKIILSNDEDTKKIENIALSCKIEIDNFLVQKGNGK